MPDEAGGSAAVLNVRPTLRSNASQIDAVARLQECEFPLCECIAAVVRRRFPPSVAGAGAGLRLERTRCFAEEMMKIGAWHER